MRPFSRWILAAIPGLVAACGASTPPSNSAPPASTATADAAVTGKAAAPLEGPDLTALDRSVSACEDFYQFACGGWTKATPIPEDETRWGRSFSVIQQRNEQILRDILERAAKGEGSDPTTRQIGDFYASCMDEASIEKNALADLQPELARIDAVKDGASLTKEVAHLHGAGVFPIFGFDSTVDVKNTTQVIAEIRQGGLGLPDRDYYFDKNKEEIRKAYEAHVAAVFELLGEKKADAKAHAATVVKLETKLAQVSMSNVELRDPQKLYHRLDRDGTKKAAPAFNWDAYLTETGFPAISAINVQQPEFVKAFGEMVKKVPMAEWRVYLRWHLLRRASPSLSAKFVDEDFNFKRTLTGAKSLPPRWKRCVRAVDANLGEALAQPFVKQTLGEEGKKAVGTMVGEIETSMKENLQKLAWMDDPTRALAEEKLHLITNKVGYPDKWIDYGTLTVDRKSYFGNVVRASAFEVRRQLTKIGKPVDKGEWFMTPPTVNAYYEPSFNEMVFPAGILQPPFYSNQSTPATNYGAIGMVIGHELTHGFDDEGRQYDGYGNLREWWTAPVSKEFDKRASCVEKQFDEYVPIEDVHIKGKLTLGENIADLGGLKLAYASYERTHKDGPTVSGFTPEQQFFLGFAQGWCTNIRPEALRLLLATNPHAPPRQRVIGPLSNMPEFAQAFQCTPGNAMVRTAEKRCEVW